MNYPSKRLLGVMTAFCIVFVFGFCFEVLHRTLSASAIHECPTRYDIALQIEKLFEKMGSDYSRNISSYKYHDMNYSRLKSIKRVIHHRIMEGYPDFTFRPKEKMRLIEALSVYAKFMRYAVRNGNSGELSDRHSLSNCHSQNMRTLEASGVLPENFDPSESSIYGLFDSDLAEQFFDKISIYLSKNHSKFNCTDTADALMSDCRIQGKVTDAFTGKNLNKVHLTIGGRTVHLSPEGTFYFGRAERNKIYEIFAAAGDYQSLLMKYKAGGTKDLILKLKPRKAKIAIKTVCALSGKPLAGTNVISGNHTELTDYLGETVFDGLKPGYYIFRSRIEGYQPSEDLVLVHETIATRTVKLHPLHFDD